MKKLPIIIDCDPGIDDAFALFYALRNPGFDVKLITSVSGNVNIDVTTRNARGIVAASGRDVRVAQGANRPLIAEPLYAEEVHGVSGLGEFTFAEDADFAPLDPMGAVDAMIDVLEASNEKVTIVAVGPLTNIAQLILSYPKLTDKVEKLSIMGGGLKGGNTNIAAEFNILVDPEAASIVFNSGLEIIMAGLDVTEKTTIDRNDLDVIKTLGKQGAMLEQMMGPNKSGNLHDVVSLVVLNKPEIFSGEKHKVVVELSGMYARGMTIADQRYADRSTDEKVWVLKDLDKAAFKEELIRGLEEYHDKA